MVGRGLRHATGTTHRNMSRTNISWGSGRHHRGFRDINIPRSPPPVLSKILLSTIVGLWQYYQVSLGFRDINIPPTPFVLSKIINYFDSRTLVVLPDFLASTRYSAAVNDLTFSRGHVVLLRTARDGVASGSATDRDTHPPSLRAHKGRQDGSDGHGRRTPRRGYEGLG